jgi:cysteine desulfurase family protein
MIYLDNAATTLVKPDCVIEAVCNAMTHLGNSGRGSHDASLGAARTIYEAREALAGFFGFSDPTRVVFTSNITESLNTVIQGLFQRGDHVITTELEHNSVLRPLYRLEDQGMELTILPADNQGNISYKDMEDAVRPNTKAVICTHASNLTGNMIDIETVGNICRKHRMLFILDSAQTAGVFPIHMERMHIDILCFTGHKGLYGPQGTGGICIRHGIELRPMKVGGSGVHTYDRTHPAVMPTALEAGTLNGHGIAGLLAAIRWLEETGTDKIQEREELLMRRFYEGVRNVPGVKIYGDFTGKKRAAIVTLNLGNYDSGEVSDELSYQYGISTRAGAHCAPLMHRALGTMEQGAVRFSFSYFNTEEEVDEAVTAVRELTR